MSDSYESLPSGYNPAETLGAYASRADLIGHLRNQPSFDLVVIGGGIHGACVAQCAALAGLKTLLLERGDYACETSSRSSKMLHGGFRYLQYLDFKQVIEGVRARERYFEIAPHLAKPERFLLPVHKDRWWHRFPLAIGFGIYDLFIRDRARKFSWQSKEKCLSNQPPFRTDGLLGAFEFCDGLTNDAALTRETITAARDEGALAINYLSVQHLTGHAGRTAVIWRDELTGEQGKVFAGAVCNTAGPFSPFISGACDGEVKRIVRYSRGVHVLFAVPWPHPSLLLPMGTFGRYYFVWPHPAGTLVGTTELECAQPEADPQPTEAEIREILQRVAQDLPNSGLSAAKLCHAFCGLRMMVAKGDGATSALSRRHKWVQHGATFTLLGGKLTTAMWTAQEGVELILKQAGVKNPRVDIASRRLPGADIEKFAEEFLLKGAQAGVSKDILTHTLTRLGGGVRHLLARPDCFDVVGRFLVSEIRHAFEREQTVTLEDLMRRRLGLEFESGHGLEDIPYLTPILRDYINPELLEQQILNYKQRTADLDRLLASAKA